MTRHPAPTTCEGLAARLAASKRDGTLRPSLAHLPSERERRDARDWAAAAATIPLTERKERAPSLIRD
jgi:hypothetical protein